MRGQPEERMKIHIKDLRELFSALLLAVIAGGIILLSSGYEMGTAFSMGPGYFPLILGGLLALLAAIVALGALSFTPLEGQAAADETFGLSALWPLTVVGGTFIAFALLLKPLGLALTCFSVLFLAGIGSRLLRPIEALITAAVLSAAAVILFVLLLDLQIRTWPW